MSGFDPDAHVTSLLDEIAPGISRTDTVEAIARLRAGLDTSSRSALRRSLADLPRALPQTYREIVAVLLRHALINRYEAAGHPMHKNVSVHQELRVLDEAELRGRVQAIEVVPGLDRETTDGLRLLSNSLRGMGVSVLELGEASARLLPDHVSSIHLAECWLETGDVSKALELLDRVTTSKASNRTRSYAWQEVSRVYWVGGNWGEARNASRRSVSDGEDRPGPVANWLVSSCYSGNRAEAVAAAEILDEMLDRTHPALNLYISWLKQDVNRLPGSQELVKGIEGDVGSASRRILDAIA